MISFTPFCLTSTSCAAREMFSNLQAYAKKSGVDVSTIIPTTFVLSAGGSMGLSTLKSHAAAFEQAKAGKPGPQLSGELWIVKPGGRNRGIGIEVMEGFKAVEEFVRKQTAQSAWVVQKYLEDPMLIHNCKFDIRQLVLVTPQLEVSFVGRS